MSRDRIVVAHNHLSGDPTPSPVTERLREAGTLLGVELLDHLVLGDGRYHSFAEEAVRPFEAAPGSAAGEP